MQAAACTGKTGYDTHNDAVRARRSTVCDIFRCDFCGKYHLGHFNRDRRLKVKRDKGKL